MLVHELFLPPASSSRSSSERMSEQIASDDTGVLRRDFEIKTMLCRLPRPLRDLLLPALLALAADQWPWPPDPARRPVACGERRFAPRALHPCSVAGLRALLVTELTLGMGLAQTPLPWLSRPARTARWALRAGRIGQVAGALACHPQAGSLTDELCLALKTIPPMTGHNTEGQ
jgi:hypothetical protein